jgi:aminoglycoside 2''-phosphotransferase
MASVKDKDELILRFMEWARNERSILGAALVGSHACGRSRPESDIDFVIVTESPKLLLDSNGWMTQFGRIRRTSFEDYGLVQSRRVFYENGVEAEFGITTARWLATDPVDSGTRDVLAGGYKLLDDKVGLFSLFFSKLALSDTPGPERLASQIRAEFPTLQFSEVDLVNSGIDHIVMILDSRWVFRFPRTREYRSSFTRELALLRELGERSPIAVPQYEFVSAGEPFGGYRIIEGKELRTEHFRSFGRGMQARIGGKLADFLSVLHSLPVRLLTASENSYLWTCDRPRRHADRYFKVRRDTISSKFPELVTLLDEFYQRYLEVRCPSRCITHGDFTDDHILVTAGGEVGIIDFADAVVDDPATDFSYLWSYGDWVPKEVLDGYSGCGDPEILNRSYWHFVRYRIDCFYSELKDGRVESARMIAADVASRLGSFPAAAM